MKPLFTGLLVCLLPFMAQAQDAIHISGITTEKDGSILIGAHIIAYDSAGYELPYKTISDINGQFDLSIPLSANVSYLTVICICYSDTIYLTDQLFQSYNIALTKLLYPNCEDNVISVSLQAPTHSTDSMANLSP